MFFILRTTHESKSNTRRQVGFTPFPQIARKAPHHNTTQLQLIKIKSKSRKKKAKLGRTDGI